MTSQSRQPNIREGVLPGLLTARSALVSNLGTSSTSILSVRRREAGVGTVAKLSLVVLRRPPVYRLQISRPAFRTVALRVSCSVVEVGSACLLSRIVERSNFMQILQSGRGFHMGKRRKVEGSTSQLLDLFRLSCNAPDRLVVHLHHRSRRDNIRQMGHQTRFDGLDSHIIDEDLHCHLYICQHVCKSAAGTCFIIPCNRLPCTGEFPSRQICPYWLLGELSPCLSSRTSEHPSVLL